MMPTWLDRKLLLATLPAISAGVVFELFLGHRHDYSGHFAAGYGGTLGALMVWMRSLPPAHFAARSVPSIVALTIACIGLGTITEATIFRLAKFDEIDFCNQSLGAVLAGLAALAYAGEGKHPLWHFDLGLIAGITFLGAGGCCAFA
jgi:hypothetical protein